MIYNKTKTDRRFVFGKDRNITERKEKSLLSRNKILEATGALFAEISMPPFSDFKSGIRRMF